MPNKHRKRSKFAQWMHQELARAGLNQQELAFHAGLHQNTISTYMRGETTPKIETLLYICDALAAFQLHEGFSLDEKRLLAETLFMEGVRRL